VRNATGSVYEYHFATPIRSTPARRAFSHHLLGRRPWAALASSLGDQGPRILQSAIHNRQSAIRSTPWPKAVTLPCQAKARHLALMKAAHAVDTWDLQKARVAKVDGQELRGRTRTPDFFANDVGPLMPLAFTFARQGQIGEPGRARIFPRHSRGRG